MRQGRVVGELHILTAFYFFILTLLAWPGDVLCSTYYVSVSGSDEDDGLSETAAWRTITHACSEVGAGDTVRILPGDYGNENAQIVNSGTPTAPIVIMADVPGTVALVGDGDDCGLSILSQSHIVVDGLGFSNYSTGLTVRYDSTHVTIQKCVFTENNDFGLLLYGTKDNPENSHSHIFTENEFYDYTDKQDYGIALYFSTHVTAANNYFYGWHHQALSFKKLMFDSVATENVFDGFQFTAIYLGQNEDSAEEGILRSHNLIASRNAFRPAESFRAKRSIMVANVTGAVVSGNFMEGHPDNDGGWGEGVGLTELANNVVIHGNVMRNIGGQTSNPGIRFYGEAANVKVFHNTMTGCAHSLGFEVYAAALFVNNIFNNDSMIRGSDAADAGNCVFSYNCIYPAWSGSGPTDISADPLFTGPFEPLVLVDEDPGFFPDHQRAKVCILKEGSPCIDSGTSLAQTVEAGEGYQIPVDDASYFTDGFGIAEGDRIRVGENVDLCIVSVDTVGNVIEVESEISWNDGDPVSHDYRGSAPDMGAYEYGLEDIIPPVITLKTFRINGSLDDSTVTSVEINGVTVPVTNGAYTHEVDVTSTDTIVITAINSKGQVVKRTIEVQ